MSRSVQWQDRGKHLLWSLGTEAARSVMLAFFTTYAAALYWILRGESWILEKGWLFPWVALGPSLAYFPLGVWLQLRAEAKVRRGGSLSRPMYLWLTVAADEMLRGVLVSVTLLFFLGGLLFGLDNNLLGFAVATCALIGGILWVARDDLPPRSRRAFVYQRKGWLAMDSLCRGRSLRDRFWSSAADSGVLVEPSCSYRIAECRRTAGSLYLETS